VTQLVGWVERSETHQNPIRVTPPMMGFAELVIGLAEGGTRWLNPSYD
jgi:hypothetical protein